MSSPSVDTRPIPSDATLVWLASERAAPLFRTLDRTRSFVPLIFLLALLPAVVATFADFLAPMDAAWGLRALDFTGSDVPALAWQTVETIVPSESVRPLALWLSGGIMRLAGTARPMSESLASLIGGAVLMFVLWPTAKSLAGPRFSFWVMLLAAFHPAIVSLLLFPAPVSVGLACTVGVIWGHLEVGDRSLKSLFIWMGIGCGLAFSMLLIGPLAGIAAAVILVDSLYAFILAVRVGNGVRTGRNYVSPLTILVRRVSAVVVGIALWGGADYLLEWRGGVGEVQSPAVLEPLEIEDSVRSLDSMVIGPLWGLAAVGAGRLIRTVNRRGTIKSVRPAPRLLLPWLVIAGVAFVWLNGSVEGRFNPLGRYVMALLSLPLLCLAAFAIEEAARRTVSGAWILLAVALPLAVRLGSFMATIGSEGSKAWIITAVVAIAAAWIFAKVVPALAPIPGMRRALLMAAILLAIAVDMMDGLFFMFEKDGVDNSQQFAAQLHQEKPRDTVVLLTDVSPPPELTFVLRSVFPHAAMEIAPSWDEAAMRLDHRLGNGVRRPIVAVWGLRDAVGAASSAELVVTGKPILFVGSELLLYVSDDDS